MRMLTTALQNVLTHSSSLFYSFDNIPSQNMTPESATIFLPLNFDPLVELEHCEALQGFRQKTLLQLQEEDSASQQVATTLLSLSVCLSVCLSDCLSVCLFVSVFLSVCLSVCLSLSHTHTHTHTHAHTYMHTHTCTHMHARIHTHTPDSINPEILLYCFTSFFLA